MCGQFDRVEQEGPVKLERMHGRNHVEPSLSGDFMNTSCAEYFHLVVRLQHRGTALWHS
jgi:hypothetical protein